MATGHVAAGRWAAMRRVSAVSCPNTCTDSHLLLLAAGCYAAPPLTQPLCCECRMLEGLLVQLQAAGGVEPEARRVHFQDAPHTASLLPQGEQTVGRRVRVRGCAHAPGARVEQSAWWCLVRHRYSRLLCAAVLTLPLLRAHLHRRRRERRHPPHHRLHARRRLPLHALLLRALLRHQVQPGRRHDVAGSVGQCAHGRHEQGLGRHAGLGGGHHQLLHRPRHVGRRPHAGLAAERQDAR